MSARAVRHVVAMPAWALLAVAAFTCAARAADAPADTTVEGYVRAMADSTDRWFGLSAGTVDTTGTDSVRAWAIAHPGLEPRRRGHGVSLAPLLGFNRVLGGGLGGEVATGAARGPGRVTASAEWTTGADLWLGGGRYAKRWSLSDADERGTRLELQAGRACEALDRDYHEPLLSAFSAFVFGNDRSDYLRRDGGRLSLGWRGTAGWLGAGARDERESPLATTATWTLFGARPVVVPNDSAFATRVHEVDAQAGLRLGRVPFTLEGHVWSAMRRLGSDVHYNRLRLAAGGAVALGRHVAFAPEFEYGRLTGDALPQDAFFLGGGTLRSLDAQSLQGTGRALAHADVLLTDALQTLLGLDPAPAFPIQLGAFAGAGSVWGSDPVSGRAVLTDRNWPERRNWLSEMGLSVMYRPGLPHPDSFLRIDYYIPIGRDGRRSGVYVSYMRALNFLLP